MVTRKQMQWLQACIANAEIFRRCQKKAFFCFIIDEYGRVAGTGTMVYQVAWLIVSTEDVLGP